MKKICAMLLMAGFLLFLCSCGSIQAPGETTEPFASEEGIVPEETTDNPEEMSELFPEETFPPTGPETVVVPQPEPGDDEFVPVLDYIPDLVIELKYATEDNFTGQVIYPFRDAFLRYGTVKKLLLAQDILRTKGLGLKLWDGFRPVSSQHILWNVYPDPVYVANPLTGFSSHSRGNTVDITLVDSDGTELTMPTGFDDFTPLADRDYSDCSVEAAENARLLQSVMEEAGFTGYSGEWWHFSDKVSYPVEENFEPLPGFLSYAMCEEYITLRKQASAESEELSKIPKDHIFTVLARSGDFLLVNYQGLRGYVLESYTQRIE